MNTFVLEIWNNEGAACTFYTVRKYDHDCDDDSSIPSETDLFFDTYAIENQPFEQEAYRLFRLITESIGNKYGAIDVFFDRNENHAQALPPKPKRSVEEIKQLGIHFPLRLYCYRITEEIVVLFGGGVKDARSAQESELSMKFQEAQSFAKKIEDALRDQMIGISTDGRHLQSFDGSFPLIL